jgi:hypothetical protein
MNRLKKAWFCCICFPILICAGASADTEMDRTWQVVRAHQPPGLQLKLILPKDHFFQGELIDGTIEITNSSANSYHLSTVEIGRAGRIHGIAFEAESRNGIPVPDPLAWANPALPFLGGMGQDLELGNWSATLPVVYSLRFDAPGDYFIWAWTNRPQTVLPPKAGQPQPSIAVALVSDKIAITIESRTAAQEAQVIADAQAKLLSKSDRLQGALELNALQTPTAWRILRTLITDKDQTGASNVASMGLMEAPDPRAEGAELLADVTSGRVPVWIATQWVYSWLERYDMPYGAGDEFEKEHKAAFQRILDAGAKATGGSGPAYVQSLWIAYNSNLLDPTEPARRAALVAHQLELSSQNKETILRNWFFELRDGSGVPANFPGPRLPSWGGGDFLPIVDETLAAPLPNPPLVSPSSPPLTRKQRQANYDCQELKDYALIILANVRPAEAKPLILADIKRPRPQFFTGSFPLLGDSRLPEVLPVTPMPELDTAFRQKLTTPSPDFASLFWTIDHYGSSALVPDVLRVYSPQAAQNNFIIRDAVRRYLQRCDPAKLNEIAH